MCIWAPLDPPRQAECVRSPGSARTHRTASPTAAAPAPGTGWRSSGSPCPQRPRPLAPWRLELDRGRWSRAEPGQRDSPPPSPGPSSHCPRLTLQQEAPWDLRGPVELPDLPADAVPRGVEWEAQRARPPRGTPVQATPGAGAGVGAGRPGGAGDSQLSEGVDGHGCALGSHLHCGGLSPVALLLQKATRGGHGHKEPRPCKLGQAAGGREGAGDPGLTPMKRGNLLPPPPPPNSTC